MNPEQNKRFHYLLNELNLMEDKASLVLQVTNGRTKSSKDLSYHEAQQLIYNLETFLKENDPRKKMVNKILSMAHEMRWVKANNPAQLDMEHVNATIIKYGYLHKPLNSYKYGELPKLVTQVEEMHKHYLTVK